ncbi:MAG: phosphotransferase, partial [Dehalococcoidia bacterium]
MRRSFCATVELDDGRRLFVKQARRAPAGELLAHVANEAAVLRWAHTVSAGDGVRPLMPELYFYDAEAQVLVTEYLDSYRPLMDHYRRRGVFGHGWARVVAGRLARCHAITRTDSTARDAGAFRLIEQAPFVTWDQVTPEQIASQPEAFTEFVEIVQNTDGLTASLRALRSGWQPRCLIHGDAKSDNIMLRPRSTSGAPDLRFIDWELAGWGDPAWDAGAVIGDYLHHWLASISPSADGTLDDWLAGAWIPFERVRGAMAAFWEAYSRHGVLGASGPDLIRAVGYAGVYLLDRALAAAVMLESLPSSALCSLQVAKQLIREPETATGRLLS